MVWLLWVKGEMMGVHASKVAAVKAVERQRVKLEEQGVDSVVRTDGLKFREDGKRGKVVVQAVKWDVMT